MDQPNLDVFALAERRLAWVDRRQSVLAQNIANANTPGYAARDLKPFEQILAEQARSGGAATLASDRAAPADRLMAPQSPNGNAVALDEQLEKIAETDGAHQLAMNLLHKYTGLFRTALGRN